MTLLAAINQGAPPIGLGVFLRAAYVDGPWAWVAVVADANYAHDVGVARAAGKQVWLYNMPGSFTPANWREGLSSLLAKAASVDAEGIIVDPENGWDPASVAAEGPAFRQALIDAATSRRVGVTSFPSATIPFALASDSVFGIPQIYGQHGAFTQSEIDMQWGRWRAAYGTRLVVGFALWVPDDHPELGDAAVYNAYLDRLPRAGGAIGWTVGQIPVHMMQAMRSWSPGHNAIVTGALGALAWVGRPAGAITIGLGIALLVMVILFAREAVSRA